MHSIVRATLRIVVRTCTASYCTAATAYEQSYSHTTTNVHLYTAPILHAYTQAYLAQVADYITKRAGQPPPTLGGSVQQNQQSANQQSAVGGFSGVGDPTGFATNVSNSYGSSSSSGSAVVVSKHFPVKSYLVFETGDVSKVRICV
jgi:hypothetical protein